MVWILITTFMVVVGSGQCADVAAVNTANAGSSECQLLKAGSHSAKSSLEKVTTSSQHLAPAVIPLELSRYKSSQTRGFANSRALGSSVLADMRFSGTSPPSHLVR